MQAAKEPAQSNWGQAKPERLIGRVSKLVRQAAYGFITTDAGENFFFHLYNTEGRTKLPEMNSVVRFTAARQDVPGKNPRAIHVEVL